jgi:hypothetical protein
MGVDRGKLEIVITDSKNCEDLPAETLLVLLALALPKALRSRSIPTRDPVKFSCAEIKFCGCAMNWEQING